MICDDVREALSARLDGEDPGMSPSVLDEHIGSCRACAVWAADLAGLHRSVRVREADVVPDLSAAVVTAAFPEAAGHPAGRTGGFLREPVSLARWGLFVVALTQVVLAAPGLLRGEASDTALHAARELGAFDVALAVGLLVAAWQPARAWGLLPVAGALGLVLGGTAIIDVIDGRASTIGEAHHLLDLAGVALLWWVARDDRRVPSGPGTAVGIRRIRAA